MCSRALVTWLQLCFTWCVARTQKLKSSKAISATTVTTVTLLHICHHCHHCHHSLPKQIREFSVGMGTLPNLAELRWYQVYLFSVRLKKAAGSPFRVGGSFCSASISCSIWLMMGWMSPTAPATDQI